MVDIDIIIKLIDTYLEKNNLDYAEANDISLYLEKNGALSHSTKGQPFRKLLREGKIPNAEQPGGKGTTWYIKHSSTEKTIFKSTQKTTLKNNTAGLNPVFNSESEILVLGTLPGKTSLKKGEYYSNSSNQFWKILSSLYNEPIPLSYSEKINFLLKNKIALWDILKCADRESSLDKDIKKAEANDIIGFINAHPSIRMIVLNGIAAMKMFKNHINFRNLPEKIKVIQLPSTSSTNTHKSLNEKIIEWSAIIKQ